MNFNFTKAKKLIIFCLLFSSVFVLSFTKSPINRAIADDLVLTCEYDNTVITSVDSNKIIATSSNGEITLSIYDDDASISTAVTGRDVYFIKSAQNGGTPLAISLPDEVATATIEITASAYVATKDVSIDLLKNGESVMPNGAISLLGTHVVEGSFGAYEYSYNPNTFSVTVSGGGEYIVSCISNSSGSSVVYFSNVKICATLNQEVPFISEYELEDFGYLPETKSEFTSSGLVYTHLGWVDKDCNVVDQTQALPAGKYYAVYASIEEKGASILMKLPTGIKLGYKLHFFDNRYIEPLILNGGLKFFGEFRLDGYTDFVSQELTTYTFIDGVLNLDICITSVPSKYYKTDVSSKLAVQFGENGKVLKSSTPTSKNVFYVANYFYNDLRESYDEEYSHQIWIEVEGERVAKYSKYADFQRDVFKTIIDDANNLD